MQLSPIAYLMAELKGRDLDSRLLIAAHLLKRGYSSIVGQYWGLGFNAEGLPKGAYLFKTTNKFQVGGMKHCVGQGHVVLAADEEALPAAEHLIAFTTHADAFKHCKAYLAAHDAHARALLRAFPEAAGKIRVAGTARADLLRGGRYPRPHEKPYILLNTGFAMLNSMWGSVQEAIKVFNSAYDLDPTRPVDAIDAESRIEYERLAMGETLALVDWLTASTEIDIVIRPHPAEKPDFWLERYSEHPRVTVVTGSDPFPWMKHAVLMIHNDSTTGIEAAIMGIPCLNLSPQDTWAHRLIVRDVNMSVKDAGEARSAISDFLAGDRDRLISPQASIFPFDSAAASAAEIASLLPPPAPLPVPRWVVMPRSKAQKEKFTVTNAEFSEAIERTFPIAGVTKWRFDTFNDSAIFIRPSL